MTISNHWKKQTGLLPFIGTLLTLAAGLGLSAHAETAGFRLETRAWRADNGQDDTWVVGPEISARLPSQWAVRARFAQGSFNAGGDVEKMQELRLDAGWRWRFFEVGAGFESLLFDTRLQQGWEWSTKDEETERNADIYGPALCLRADGKFGSLPLGWHASASWMFADFGGMNDVGRDGTHVDLEASLSLDLARVNIAAGYRFVRFADLPARDINGEKFDRNTLDGAFAAVTFRF